MSGLTKRLEKIERDLAADCGESLELQICFVKGGHGEPRMRTRAYSPAQLAELPAGSANDRHEWFPDDGRGAA